MMDHVCSLRRTNWFWLSSEECFALELKNFEKVTSPKSKKVSLLIFINSMKPLPSQSSLREEGRNMTSFKSYDISLISKATVLFIAPATSVASEEAFIASRKDIGQESRIFARAFV
eukprot:TCONS_00030738-protein